MKDSNKTKEQLINELKEMRQGITKLEASEVARKKAEEKRRESEEKYEALHNNFPLCYQSLDEDGFLIDVNPAWLRMLGYKREEVIGKWFGDFLHPDWKPHFKKNFSVFKKRGYVHDVQFKIRHREGHYSDISFEGCIGYYPDGSFKQTYCVFQDITERKQTEQIIHEQRDRLQKYLDVAGIIFVTIDNNERISMINHKGCEILGYQEDEIIGKNWFDTFLPEKIRGEVRIVFRRLMAGEIMPAEYFENPVLTKSGEERTIFWHNALLTDNAGNINGVLGSGDDITKRKQMEDELLESRTKLQSILSSIPDLIFVFDKEGRFTLSHHTSDEELYVQPEEFVGKRYSDVLPPHVSKLVDNAFDKNKKGNVAEFDYDLNVGGENKSYSVKLSPILMDNDFAGCVAVVRDITERINRDKKIVELYERNELILNTMIDGYILADTKGKIIDVNPSYCDFIGYAKEELLEMNIIDLEAMLTPTEVGRKIEQMVKQGFTRFESKHKKKDGSIIDLEVSIMILPNDTPLVASFVRDITERKQIEEELKQYREHLEELVKTRTTELEKANQHKSRFLANMSHELRTPLNSIIGFTKLMLDGLEGDINEAQHSDLHTVYTNSKHLLELINGLLDLSQIEAGKTVFSYEAFTISDLLAEAIPTMKQLAMGKGLALTYSVAPGIEHLYADKTKTKQVLINILANAVKFTDEGSIKLDVAETDSDFIFSVTDTGIGIKEEDLAAIFDSFKQVGPAQIASYEGTGLGLTISKRFIEMQGGRIWAESKLAKGTTFTFTLPKKKAASP